jgi:hypothetical protein
MGTKERLERKQQEIAQLAEGWGKLVAEHAFPDGVGLDIDLFQMEELAIAAARGLVRGTIETATQRQAECLQAMQACPGCGQECPLERRARSVQVRGGEAELDEPVAHCSACRRDFFPSTAHSQAGRTSL